MNSNQFRSCLETYHKNLNKELYKKKSRKEIKSGIEDIILIVIIYFIVSKLFL
jgi:hypothetical protein